MEKVIKKKWGLELVSSHYSRYETSPQNLYIGYILFDQVWWCNIKRFLSYSKNYIWKFMQDNSWHHKLFHLQLSFWVWKVWKGSKKDTKILISRERKELFRWNKKIFHSFWRNIIWWKNKNLIKDSVQKL